MSTILKALRKLEHDGDTPAAPPRNFEQAGAGWARRDARRRLLAPVALAAAGVLAVIAVASLVGREGSGPSRAVPQLVARTQAESREPRVVPQPPAASPAPGQSIPGLVVRGTPAGSEPGAAPPGSATVPEPTPPPAEAAAISPAQRALRRFGAAGPAGVAQAAPVPERFVPQGPAPAQPAREALEAVAPSPPAGAARPPDSPSPTASPAHIAAEPVRAPTPSPAPPAPAQVGRAPARPTSASAGTPAREPAPRREVAATAPARPARVPARTPARAARTEAASPPRPSAPPASEAVRHAVPDLTVTGTRWHPDRSRREATIALAGRPTPLRLHEGDAVGPLVVQEIEPAAVVFVIDGVELRRPVGRSR